MVVAKKSLRQRISELINGPRRITFRWATQRLQFSTPTQDNTRPDYGFWDKARRGKAQGLELSGLFLKPLASKTAAWTIGAEPLWRIEDKYTRDKFTEWYRSHHSALVRAYETAVALGDCFVVVNADLSLTVLAPNTVEPMVNSLDYSKIEGWRILQSYQDPAPDYEIKPTPQKLRPGVPLFKGSNQNMPQTIRTIAFEDIYTKKSRTRTKYVDATPVSERKYPNPTDLITVVHVPNDKGVDELWGRPAGEGILPALERYGAIFDSAIDGNIRQGRPTPVISKLGTAADVKAFWDKHGRNEQQVMPDGTVENTPVIDLDADQVITLGGDAQFKWESPGTFMTDTQTILGLLFYLILQHTEIPEFIWGNAITASRASADTQLSPFVKWVEKKRGECTVWMLELARVVLSIMALSDRRIKADSDVSIKYMTLTEKDGRLTKETVAFAIQAGLIDKKTALELLPLEIDNPEQVIAIADKEQDEQRQKLEDAAKRQLEDRAEVQMDTMEKQAEIGARMRTDLPRTPNPRKDENTPPARVDGASAGETQVETPRRT